MVIHKPCYTCVLPDLSTENYCKTVSLNLCGLLLLFWTNFENISRLLIFADLDLPRNSAKIGRRENFPFYGYRYLNALLTYVFFNTIQINTVVTLTYLYSFAPSLSLTHSLIHSLIHSLTHSLSQHSLLTHLTRSL